MAFFDKRPHTSAQNFNVFKIVCLMNFLRRPTRDSPQLSIVRDQIDLDLIPLIQFIYDF